MEFDLRDSRPHYGDYKRHQELFIQHLLESDARSLYAANDDTKVAHEVVKRWIALEESGKLARKNETALEGEFLTQIFGEALGHTLWSDGKPHWHVEPKLAINGGQADAALGYFPAQEKAPLAAVIELKGPTVDLDRDRFNGRTPVEQCWSYMNLRPDCPWGIVSNFVSIRLYHRDHSPREYQLFLLKDLFDTENFHRFFYLFSVGGLVAEREGDPTRALKLLHETGARQKEVGEELYGLYYSRRRDLIKHLTLSPHSLPLEEAIRITQKLLDRIVFIAFCEDRRLIPEQTIGKAYEKFPAFYSYNNPKWRNFRELFRMMDKGESKFNIPPFNGGLFRVDEPIDNMELEDEWTGFFHSISKFDFRDEVNVEVLGHLFERSVHDLENIMQTGLLGEIAIPGPKMGKSAERKRHGIYYTPKDFTSFIVRNVVGFVIEERFEAVAQSLKMPISESGVNAPDAARARLWSECLDVLRKITVVDPACGSGAFLIAAYELLEDAYTSVVDKLVYHGGNGFDKLRDEIPSFILKGNLYGVDLSEEAVEITQLALWIRTANQGKTLEDLSKNIVWGNSLVDDPAIHPKAINWKETFPHVFCHSDGGFDCVIGNPPWERIKLQEREFFDSVSGEIAAAVNAATRRTLIEQLRVADPEIYQRYEKAKGDADRLSVYIRESNRYELTGKGDINTYAVFAELAFRIVSSRGKVGLLVPSGIATDDTTKDFFGKLVSTHTLHALYDFENKAPIFPDVHRSFKLSILIFGGSGMTADKSRFAFFAHRLSDLNQANRLIELQAEDIKLLNPNTLTCPIFRTRRDAEITKSIYERIPILVNASRGEDGNPWGIKFLRMFDQTNDAGLFKVPEDLKKDGYRLYGNIWKKGKIRYLPLYEAKMVQMFDHRAASVRIEAGNWVRQGQTEETPLVLHKNPDFAVIPRWWVSETKLLEVVRKRKYGYLCFKDVTSATNQRTVIAAFIPLSAVVNSAPLLIPGDGVSPRLECCLLANLNSFVLDYIARQKVGGLHLNFFVVEQFPILPQAAYAQKCPWNQRQSLEKWISERALKLTCTSNDMIPLAKEAGFDPPVHKWDPAERAKLMAELDAAYFLLYGIERDDVEYILSTFSGTSDQPEGFFGNTSKAGLILEQYDLLRSKCK